MCKVELDVCCVTLVTVGFLVCGWFIGPRESFLSGICLVRLGNQAIKTMNSGWNEIAVVDVI